MKTLRNHVISKIIITLLILGLLGCGLYTDRQIMLTVICIGLFFCLFLKLFLSFVLHFLHHCFLT